MSLSRLKQEAASAAIQFIQNDDIVGVGTGSTTECFIEALAQIKNKIQGAVASSHVTETSLRKYGIPVLDLNTIGSLRIYVDGADEFNSYLQLVKGGGGALTREKIIAHASESFICIVDESKRVEILGKFPVAVEVIPMARALVARSLVKLGASPVYRENFLTDNGNIILDTYHLDLSDPISLEKDINNIAGVITNGIFALRPADKILMATAQGIATLVKP
jgi:ribose 5-phosphate isomerase A